MIALTGATGQLGRLVIDRLLALVPRDPIVGAVRTPAKAADLAARGIVVRAADYNDAASLDRAFAGVDRLLLISSSELGQRVAQHRNVIAAAKRQQVKLLAYTSVLHADASVLGLAEEHRQTEAAIKSSGVPFVILRNGWYTENYTAAIGGALAHGAFIGSAGKGRIASAARADYAEAAAAVLAGTYLPGKTYELAGDSAYTLDDFAAELSRQAGKPVPYVNLPEADYRGALLGAGLPAPIAELLANSDTGASQDALFDASHELRKLIGRASTPWAESIRAALKK